MSFIIANFSRGPFLTTGHFLKDGGFSSIPSTYEQHTEPIEVSVWIIHVGEVYEAEVWKW